MHINDAGINLIKGFENFKAKPYLCTSGVWTIGYGHTAGVTENSNKVSEKEATELLKKDIENAEKLVNKYQAKYNFNENQFSALVSFAFNHGTINDLTENGTRSIEIIKEKILEYNNIFLKFLKKYYYYLFYIKY